MSLASIQKEILQLNPKERAMLIDLLWESLDEARIRDRILFCVTTSALASYQPQQWLVPDRRIEKTLPQA